jgi:hypothetical protein
MYGVATIILVGSGIWPHFKLFLLVAFNWFPLSNTRKLSIVHWLSELGKWLDTYFVDGREFFLIRCWYIP